MDLKRNLQVNQPNVAQLPEGNGWPEPLGDNSDPLRMKVTNGRNGDTRMEPKLQTSQQKEVGHHAPEGRYAATPGTNGPSVSDPGGGVSGVDQGFVGTDRGDYTGIPKTSQQKRGDHSAPEGR